MVMERRGGRRVEGRKEVERIVGMYICSTLAVIQIHVCVFV
jgi:hypothetical protein